MINSFTLFYLNIFWSNLKPNLSSFLLCNFFFIFIKQVIYRFINIAELLIVFALKFMQFFS